MKRTKFSLEQRQELLQNANIVKVNDNSIEYSREFKIYAIKQQKLGVPSRLIFLEKGIPDWLNRSEYAKYCIKRWKKIVERDGELSFKVEKEGGDNIVGSKSLSDMNQKELLTKIAYLEAENDFLKKLKALETV